MTNKYIIKLGLGIWGLCSRSTGRTEYMAGSTKARSACSVLCTAGNIKSGGRAPF